MIFLSYCTEVDKVNMYALNSVVLKISKHNLVGGFVLKFSGRSSPLKFPEYFS